MWNPPDSWYEPPEHTPCCSKAEDEEDHDSVACLEEQAEEAAERKAEAMAEREPYDDVW